MGRFCGSVLERGCASLIDTRGFTGMVAAVPEWPWEESFEPEKPVFEL